MCYPNLKNGDRTLSKITTIDNEIETFEYKTGNMVKRCFISLKNDKKYYIKELYTKKVSRTTL